MITRFSHVGIAVANIHEALPVFTQGLGLKLSPEGVREFPEHKFRNAMLPIGDNFIELLDSSDPNTDIGRFLQRHGEGLFHICLRVDDIESEIAGLKSRGVELLEAPASPHIPYKRAFVRRRAAHGALIELAPGLHPLH